MCYVLRLRGQIKLDPSRRCPTQPTPECCQTVTSVAGTSMYQPTARSHPVFCEFPSRPLPAIPHGPLYLATNPRVLEQIASSQSQVQCHCLRTNLWRRHSTQQVKYALSLHLRCPALPHSAMHFRQLCLEHRLAPRPLRLAVRPDASLQLK